MTSCPDEECVDLGHDLRQLDDRPEVQECSRCGCLFQDSGATLDLVTDDGIVAIPNSVIVWPG